MSNDIFPVLILTGRPASGKSEIIDHLQNTPDDVRRQRYHLGRLDVIDDFPMLWTWFEEDHLLSTVFNQPRLHSDEQGYFLQPYMWHLLIERIGLEYHKRLRDAHDHDQTTALIEFSRGTEHGGYAQAFPHLPVDLLQRAAILYVRVSFEESLRKNRRRYNPERPDSILEHGLEDEKLERLYRLDDWEAFTAADPNTVTVNGVQVPYAVFENEDDVTTGKPEKLAARLRAALDALWAKRQAAA